MSNPFSVKGEMICDECGVDLIEGDISFCHKGDYICEDCANKYGVVCECGNYKKEQYPTCYSCRNIW